MTSPSIELVDSTIQGFLTDLAAKQPVPGGGAVAGITTALSAGLGGMVVAYSVGKSAFKESESMLRETGAELAELRSAALRQGEEDAAAYARLNALWGLTKDHPDRTAGWIDAVEGAILAPGAIMRTADRVLELLARLPGRSAKHLASDLAIGVELAATGARAAERNVMVNLPLLPEGEIRERHDATFGEIGARVDARAREILEQLG